MSKPTQLKTQSLIVCLLDGIAVKLGQAFGLPKPVLTTSNNPLAEFLRRANGQKDGESVQYPFFYIKPRSFGLNQGSYSPSRMAKSPLVEMLGTQDGVTFEATRFIPTLVPIEVGFITNDSVEYLQFAANWTALAKAGRFNFDYVYRGIKLGILVEAQDSIEIPEIDQGDDINQSVGVVSLTMHGYVELPGRPSEEVGMVTPQVSIRVNRDDDDIRRYQTFAQARSKARSKT